MGKRLTYVVAGEFFPTQKALKERIRRVIDETPLGGSVAADDYEFVRSLLDRHPDADQKVGCGVVDLEVDRAKQYDSICFYLVRSDGTRTDFSWPECITPSTAMDMFKSAARNTIAAHKMNFKVKFFTEHHRPRCPDSGEPISLGWSNVDHAGEWPFERIVTEFVAEQRIDVEAIAFTGKRQDNTFLTEFADDNLRDAFLDYHHDRAVYEVVSPPANQARRRQRKK